MPLTLSHPAAAWPVRRLAPWLPLDALVLGTMSPDFEYVLRLAVRGRFGHTLPGFFLFCLPVGLAAWGLFRLLVRPALLPLFPSALRPRDTGSWPAAAVAVLAGAATHDFWDGFTHKTGWFVELYPVLRERTAAGVPWYSLLQHASTLAGGLTITVWLLLWLRHHTAEARRFAPGQRTAAIRAAAVIVGGGVLAGVLNGSRAIGSGAEWILGYAAVGGMAGLAAGMLAYGAAVRMHR